MDGFDNLMDQPAPTDTPESAAPAAETAAFEPRNLHYDLRADQPFVCFSGAGLTTVPVTLSVGKGAPLSLYDGSARAVTIGAQLFVNTGVAEEPQRGALIGEYRAESGPFVAHKGQHYARSLPLYIAPEMPGELILVIDLVKETCFWGADLGHKPLTLLVTQRRVAIRPAQPDPLDMTEALTQLHETRARELRYEAVIFSLLNQLSKRDA